MTMKNCSGFFRLLWAFIFVEMGVILFLSISRHFSVDELESIQASWKIFSGHRIYADFYEHHHPFFYYMLALLIGIFKEGVIAIIASRLLVFLMILLIFAITYNISKKLFGKEPAVISLILLSTTNVFVFTAIELRPDVPQVLFGLISISLLLSFFQSNKLKHLVLSSISLGVSFLFLQKSIFLGLIIGVLLLLGACSRQIKFKDAVSYLLVFLATLMPYYGYLILSGQLPIYWIYNWTMNVALFNCLSSRGDGAIITLLSSFKDAPLLWIFWLISMLFLDTSNQIRAGAVSLFLLIIFILVQCPFKYYLMLVLPLIAMMAGHAMCQLINVVFKRKSLLICLIAVIYIFYVPNLYLNITKNHPDNSKQLKKMEYVLLITKQKDLVYGGEGYFILFRENVDRFWSGQEALVWLNNKASYYRFNVYEMIDRSRPKVILNNDMLDMKDYRIANNYRRSDKYPDLYVRIN